MNPHPALCFLLFSALAPLLAQTPPAKPVLTAVVTDNNGQATTVSALQARYVYNTNRSGDKVLIDEADALVFQLEAREGHVYTTDEVRVPFAEIRRFRLISHQHVEIEKRDGSRLLLDQITGSAWKLEAQHKLEEKGPDGAVRKTTPYHECAIALQKQDGEIAGTPLMRQLQLRSLRGKAKTASGREGEFSIGLTEVKEVEFK